MKKAFIIIIFLLCSEWIMAQYLGINTTDPKTTLDVVAYSKGSDTAEGVIIPTLTCSQLKAKTGAYPDENEPAGSARNPEDYLGTMVYISEIDCSLTTTDNPPKDFCDFKHIEIVEPGIYTYTKETRTLCDDTKREVYLWRRLKANLGITPDVETDIKIYEAELPTETEFATIGDDDLKFALRPYTNGNGEIDRFEPVVCYNTNATTIADLTFGVSRDGQQGRGSFLKDYSLGEVQFTTADATTFKPLTVDKDQHVLTSTHFVCIFNLTKKTEADKHFYRITYVFMPGSGTYNRSLQHPNNKYSILIEKY